MIITYPIYKNMSKKSKDKYASEIIELSNQLLDE